MDSNGTSDSAIYRGGMADPVFDAQSVFRLVMDALARPGTIQSIDALTEPPPPLTASVGAIALTLFDHDTPIWLDPQLARQEPVAGWLAFHTGAPLVTQPIDAHFAVVANTGMLPSLEAFSQGTQEYPDRSTTLILQIERLLGGEPLLLTGPGIADQASIAPVGLPPRFPEQWEANGNRFPRGVDLILAGREGILGLPRTTHIGAAAELEGTSCT